MKWKKFFEALIGKKGSHRNDFIIVMDNASYLVNKEIKDYLTVSSYYLSFNAIEYEFFNIKINLYKYLFKNRKELKETTLEILSLDGNKKAIKIYIWNTQIILSICFGE